MKKRRLVKLFKISACMTSLLMVIILVIALLDPNVKTFFADKYNDGDNGYYVISSQYNSSSSQNQNPNKVNSSDKSSKETNAEETEENQVILRNPAAVFPDLNCEHCKGTGKIECLYCLGIGMTDGNTLCTGCGGDGKINCYYCD